MKLWSQVWTRNQASWPPALCCIRPWFRYWLLLWFGEGGLEYMCFAYVYHCFSVPIIFELVLAMNSIRDWMAPLCYLPGWCPRWLCPSLRGVFTLYLLPQSLAGPPLNSGAWTFGFGAFLLGRQRPITVTVFTCPRVCWCHLKGIIKPPQL